MSDLVLTENSSSPSAPPSGTVSIYPKSDGNFYTQNSAGTESSLVGPAGPTGPGVPNGGTTKQILAKNSSTNDDTGWFSALAVILTNTGTLGSPTGISAAGGITPANLGTIECQFIIGNGAAVVVTATYPIAIGNAVGQILILYGTSDTDTVTLNNGTNLSLNGDITIGLDDMIALLWNGTYWNEIARRR